MVKRFDIYLVKLSPTVGSEVKKTRPAVIISPDEMNRHLHTVIIAPLTSTIKNYPTRIKYTLKGKKSEIMLDQIRTVDKSRLVKKLGTTSESTSHNLCQTLADMFMY